MEVIMDIKVGDEVTVLNTSDLNDWASIFIKKFNKYKVVFISEDKIGLEYSNGCYCGVNISCLGLYETSNRKKLKDAVIKTGFSSKDLSIAMGFNDNYLSGYISKSRMSERGDISEEQLNSLKVSILFAERTLNGTGAETVDELKFGDAKLECGSNITESDKKEINAETEIDSEFQFVGGGYDPVFDMPEYQSTTSETQYHVTNNYAPKYSNFIKLQKLAFAICFIMAILLISILYFVVSK